MNTKQQLSFRKQSWINIVVGILKVLIFILLETDNTSLQVVTYQFRSYKRKTIWNLEKINKRKPTTEFRIQKETICCKIYCFDVGGGGMMIIVYQMPASS